MREPVPVVGRDPELALLREFVEGLPSGPAALVLEGEPGIGKTTLLRAAVDLVRASCQRVLSARPASAETALAYSGLADLWTGVPVETLDELPAPQRRALAAALLEEENHDPLDARPVASGFLAAVRLLAGEGPLLLAVDDVQWLDARSRTVLEFAVRRLEAEPVGVLLARRPEPDAAAPLGLDRALPGRPFRVLEVGPLSLGALHRMLVETLGLSLPRPVLRKLHHASGGNPFYALEIARALARRGARLEPGADLHVPGSLRELVADRLAALPADAIEACRIVALMIDPTVGTVELALGGRATEPIDQAITAGVLESDGRRLRFTHPLFAAEAAAGLGPQASRALHARLALMAHGPEDRARHLARSSDEPSADLAASLDEAAEHAAARGAPDAAAEFAELAAERTPAADPGGRSRRLLRASEHLMAAGDPARARTILELLARELPHGPGRAAVLWRLADAVGDDLDRCAALCRQALAEAGDDPALEVDIRLALAMFEWLRGDLEGAAGEDRRAVTAAERAGDARLLAMALADLAHAEVVLGRGLDRAAMDRAIELERDAGGFPAQLRPSFQLGVLLMYLDELYEARPLLLEELDRTTRAGDEAGRMIPLYRLTELELRAGNWTAAEAHARESLALAEQAGIEQELGIVLSGVAWVLAHLGRVEEAREAGSRALALAVAGGDVIGEVRSRGALGFVELSLGDATAAHGMLGPAADTVRRMGVGEFSMGAVVHNEVEALVALGLLDEAGDLVGFMQEKGRPTGRAWTLAMAARGRALIAAARGDLDHAQAEVGRALEQHQRLPQPFELARTLLLKGTIERRAKRKRAAREAIEAALATFDGLGATLWAKRGREELARIGGRAPTRFDLTPSEARVAELAAAGLTNREVAAALFVTVSTVEGHLKNVYAKLGVRSRAELGRRLAADEATGDAGP